jgi:hypothetical protein
MENVVKIPVHTIWMNKCGVRGRFIADCKAHREPLIIEHKGKFMTIPCSKIDELTVGSTELPVKDYFHGVKDYLFYFKWNPDPVIQKEFIL